MRNSKSQLIRLVCKRRPGGAISESIMVGVLQHANRDAARFANTGWVTMAEARIYVPAACIQN